MAKKTTLACDLGLYVRSSVVDYSCILSSNEIVDILGTIGIMMETG